MPWGLCSYINASIIMNLLTLVIPKFKEWSQEGLEEKKLSQLTRYGDRGDRYYPGPGVIFLYCRYGRDKQKHALYVIIVISLTAGTAFLMWMGELITEKGIGTDLLLIFAGIVAGFPVGVTQVVEQVRHGLVRPYIVLVVLSNARFNRGHYWP